MANQENLYCCLIDRTVELIPRYGGIYFFRKGSGKKVFVSFFGIGAASCVFYTVQ